MKIRKMAVGLVAFSLVAVTAACGGNDSTSRNRNAALAGKQQCLSDDKSTIDNSGLATLSFCDSAKYYSIVAADGTEGDAASVGSDGTAEYQAVSDLDVVRVKSFDANKILVGEDQVTLTLPSCASGATCALGDTGPGGGIVVYDAGSKQSWGQYIEMARRGWYDGTTAAESPSGDPSGNFGCAGTDIGTSIELGTGADNTAKWLDKCNDSPEYGVRAYKYVADFNASKLSPVDTWVLPSFRDLYETHAAPVSVLESLRFPVDYPNLLVASSEDPNARAGQTCVYGYFEWGTSTIAARNNYYNLDRSRCASVTAKSIWNSFPVRPVHYFSATGGAGATIAIVGQMDIPVPPTTEVTTTTTIAPDEVPAPTGIQINGGETLVVSWSADEAADKTSTVQVLVSEPGEKARTFPATSGTSAEIPFSEFKADVEYSFVVQRVSKDSDKTAESDPLSVTPVRTIGDSGSTPTTTAGETTTTVEETTTTPEETPTTVEVTTTTLSGTSDSTVAPGGSDTTTASETRDCTMAPWVGIDPKGDLTSDDLVTLRFEHTCMANLRDGEEQYVISATTTERDGEVFPAITTSIGVSADATSFAWSRHLAPGVHKYMFRFEIVDWSRDVSYTSDWTLVTVTVGEGGKRSIQPCDLSGVSVVGTTLTFKCSDLSNSQVEITEKNEWKSLPAEIAEDKESATFDLSEIGNGWKTARVLGSSGADVYWHELIVCISKCDVPTATDNFKLTVDGAKFIVTQPEVCADSPVHVSQLQKLGPNLMAVLTYGWFESQSSADFNMEKGTDAVLMQAGELKPECTDRRMYKELVAIDRGATTPETPVVANAPVLIEVPVASGGLTDLPAGTVKSAPLVVDPGTTTAVVTPATAEALYDAKVAGSEVSMVEFSFDGGMNWVELPKTGATLPLFQKTTSIQFRLTNSKGETTIISREVDRAVPKVVNAEDVERPAGKSSGVPVFVWILLVLVLLGGATAAARRKPQAN